jgi:hypothetical protein
VTVNKQVTTPGEGHENRWTSTPSGQRGGTSEMVQKAKDLLEQTIPRPARIFLGQPQFNTFEKSIDIDDDKRYLQQE